MQTLRILALSLLLAAAAGAGCISEKKARQKEHESYVAGQEQAMQAAQRAQRRQGPVVFVQGPVVNPVVPWEEGLTLSRAIVEADYTGFMNPEVIRVLRQGQVVGQFKGIDLLHHEDMALEDGDTVLVGP